MGGMSGLMAMLPGIGKMKNQLAERNLDDSVLKRQMAIIDSMTPGERKHPDMLKASRKKRIAAGSGTKVEEINKLLKMHRTMADVMKAMGGGKARGPMAGLAQMMGLGGGMPSPEEMAKLAEKMPGGCRAAAADMPGLPPNMPGLPGSLPPKFPGLPGLPASAASCRRPAGCRRISPDWGRRNEQRPLIITQRIRRNLRRKEPQCPSSSAWPAPEPRSGRSITSSSPTAAARATAASSSGSATSIRCCRRTSRSG